MLIVLTLLVFEIAAVRARCLILKTERELSVVGDVSDKIGVAYFLIGRWEPTSDLSFFTTSRLTPHSIWVAAGVSPRQIRNRTSKQNYIYQPRKLSRIAANSHPRNP